MVITVENNYSDGHESVQILEVDDPVFTQDRPVTDQLGDYLFRFTGDGHGIEPGIDACYTVTVQEAKDPTLVGRKIEWF